MGTPGQAGRGGAAPNRRLVGPGKQPVCVRLPTGKLLWVVVPRGCLVQDLEDEGVHAPSARPPPPPPPPPRAARRLPAGLGYPPGRFHLGIGPN
jgi:hypothetical protein